jgi:hypothetical protein
MFRYLVSLILAGAMFAPAVFAQQAPAFIAYRASSLSGSTEKITIQQGTTSGRRTTFVGADVYCSVDCVITLALNGAAATATALTPAALHTGQTVSNTAWRSSDVGAGTTINVYSISAGTTLPIDLGYIRFTGVSSGQNLSLGTDSITGDVRMAIVWVEE